MVRVEKEFTAVNIKSLGEFISNSDTDNADKEKLFDIVQELIVLKNSLDFINKELQSKYIELKQLADYIYNDSSYTTFISICDALDVSTDFILQKTREHKILNFRHVIAYLMVKVYKYSLVKTAKVFNLHHATIINSCERVECHIFSKDKKVMKILDKFYTSNFYLNKEHETE